jgi:hypothetical protein
MNKKILIALIVLVLYSSLVWFVGWKCYTVYALWRSWVNVDFQNMLLMLITSAWLFAVLFIVSKGFQFLKRSREEKPGVSKDLEHRVLDLEKRISKLELQLQTHKEIEKKKESKLKMEDFPHV